MVDHTQALRAQGKKKVHEEEGGQGHSGNIYPLHSFILTKFHVENSRNDLNF